MTVSLLCRNSLQCKNLSLLLPLPSKPTHRAHVLSIYLFLESLGNSAPIDDIPNGAKVLGLAVLVLQVVGVLPGVDAEQGLEVSGDGVLVGAGDEAEGARGLVLDQPGPAGALDAGEGGVGLLLEVVEGAKVLVDGGLISSRQHPQNKLVAHRVKERGTSSLPSGSPPPPLPLGARFSQKRL